MKCKVGIIDKDVLYLDRFVQRFSNVYADKFELFSFTNLESFKQASQKVQLDIVLASDEIKVSKDLIPARTGFAYLTSDNDIEMIEDFPAIGKYQSADIDFSIEATDLGAGIQKSIVSINGKVTEQKASAYQEEMKIKASATEEAENSEGYLLQVDVSNNAEEKQMLQRKVLLDKTAPEITLSGIENDVISNKTEELSIKVLEKIYNLAEVTLKAEKTIDGVASVFNIGEYNCSAVETLNSYSFNQDGIYHVSVSAIDKAKNAAEDKEIEFTIDKTAPEIIISGTAEEAYHADDVLIKIEVTESFYETNEVTLKATRTIDGSTSTYDMGVFKNTGKNSLYTHSFTQDGKYTVEVTAQDKAGNEGEKQMLSFTVDKTAPELYIEGIDNYYVTDQATSVVFGVVESFYDTNTVQISVSRENVGGKTKTVPTPLFKSVGEDSKISCEFKEEGIYTLGLFAIDKAGNETAMEKVLTIDTSFPIINYKEEYNGKYLQSFQLKHTINEMIQDFTIADYSLTLNGDLYDGISVIKKEGKYLFKVVVTDEVKHTSTKQAEFIIDNTVPDVIFTGAENGMKSYEPINLTVKLADEEDRITSIRINGEEKQIAENQDVNQYKFEQFDTYKVEVTAIDYAMNKSSGYIEVKYSEKPFYLKLYENKPVFYGTIAGGGALVISIGVGIASGGFGLFSGTTTLGLRGKRKKY